MKWTKISIKTTVEAEEMLSYELSEAGFEGIEIEDNVPISEEDKAAMYIDLDPDDLKPDDGLATLSCYIEIGEEDSIETTHMKALEAKSKAEKVVEDIRPFFNVGEGTVSLSETEDIDWINNWKKFFKPFRLDEDIIIKPTWETVEDKKDTDIVVEIDPGTAFGTGSHETTRLCISQIKKYMKKDDLVLDLGCGSGILSIIALKLGAKKVVGTDIDPLAIEATKENLVINHMKVGCDTPAGVFESEKLGGDKGVVDGGKQTDATKSTDDGKTLDGSNIVSDESDKASADSSKAVISVNRATKNSFTTDDFKAGVLSKDDMQSESMTPILGNLIDDEDVRATLGDKSYDIVVANILADVIIPLSSIAKRFLKEGGYFITSGIIDFKADEVKQAMIDAGFEIVDVIPMGEWVSIVGK